MTFQGQLQPELPLSPFVFAAPHSLRPSLSPSLNPSPAGVLALRVFRSGPDSDRGGARPNPPD